MENNAIEIRDLTKKYRDVCAVDALSLDIREGELFALLGVNGAGKTTTVNMLSCITRPTGGDASVCGRSIRTEPDRVKQVIGVSPQETAVAANLTVKENLKLLCGIYGLNAAETAARMDGIASRLGLTEVMDRKAGKLSGGWQRRLSIALALTGQPKVLFLDEPSLGLDVLARSELWDAIRALRGSTTVILTTHYMEEAAELADRVGIMKAGRLIALGTCEELERMTCEETLEKAFVKLVREANA